MSSLQRHIAVVTDTTANLIAQLRELDLLREQVRKAEEFYAEQSQVLIDEKDTTTIESLLRIRQRSIFNRLLNVSYLFDRAV
jgi:hypothetical protein